MEILRNMLSASRIIRLLILVLAAVAVWKIWDYIGWSRYKQHSQPEPHMPLPVRDSNIKEVAVSSSRLRVQVFYEPLCPDSRYFIKYQLTPAMDKLGEHIDLQFVPYGKARTFEEGGSLRFDCQHGPTECLANKVHGCIVKEVSDQRLLAKIVDCMITDNYKPKSVGQKCVAEVLGKGHWAPIHQCYTTRTGDQILKHMGALTDSLDPGVTFIPTLTVDGSQNDQKHLQQDFTKALCKRIKSDVVPKVCTAP